jgi:quercetin dioxygenase-like cupin family protein
MMLMTEMEKSVAVHVPAGRDRHGDDGARIWGLIPMATLVASADTGGGVYVFQHTDMGKGGPPRHVHFGQDEWFYVVRGTFVMEVADRRHVLRPGDSLLAPRDVPHAWACVSDEPGTLITAVTPAGTFETFLRETTRHATLPSPDEIARAFADHGMQVLGPPLDVSEFLGLR